MRNSDSLRERAIERLAAVLKRRGSPFFRMLFYTVLSIIAGVFASIVLHAAGVTSMMIRFPLCVGIAYVAFLLQLSFFVAYHRSVRRNSATFVGDIYINDYSGMPELFPVHGGNSATATGPNGSGGGGFHLSVDGEGIVVVLLVLIAFGSAFLASAYVVLQAPVILAEILVDGALFIGLARRMKRLRPQSWVSSIVQRTALPLIAVAACYAVVGLSLECLVPGATTMIQAYEMSNHQSQHVGYSHSRN